MEKISDFFSLSNFFLHAYVLFGREYDKTLNIFLVCAMREQEREELVILLGLEVGTEVGEEEVERLREVEKRAREVQERLACAVCKDREVTFK